MFFPSEEGLTASKSRSMKQLTLNVKSREALGRGPVRRLRASGMIPAVVYGASGHHNLEVDHAEFLTLRRASGGGSVLVQIAGDGIGPTLSIVSEVQIDALRDTVMHIDFHEVERGKMMHAKVAIHTIGEPIGVKMDEGILQISAHELEVRCFPQDLPEHIEIDVSELQVGDSIQVANLTLPDGVEFDEPSDRAVVTCLGKSPEIIEEEVEPEEGEVSDEEAEGEVEAEETSGES
jgi:large subunit ribosomal protein L25